MCGIVAAFGVDIYMGFSGKMRAGAKRVQLMAHCQHVGAMVFCW